MISVASQQPSRREILSGLQHKLVRIHAAGDSISSLTSSSACSDATLFAAVQSLEHDLLLAVRETEAVRERIRTLNTSSDPKEPS